MAACQQQKLDSHEVMSRTCWGGTKQRGARNPFGNPKDSVLGRFREPNREDDYGGESPPPPLKNPNYINIL